MCGQPALYLDRYNPPFQLIPSPFKGPTLLWKPSSSVLSIFNNRKFLTRGPPRGLEITLSRRFFGQITPRNCLKFMFTPSLPNRAGCQIDFSRNHAIIFSQFTFSRYEICPITPSRVPLGGSF